MSSIIDYNFVRRALNNRYNDHRHDTALYRLIENYGKKHGKTKLYYMLFLSAHIH